MSTDPARQRRELRLYISGQVDSGRKAASELRRICVQILGDADFDLQVIDVRERPELAEEDKVLATPTLIRRAPPPQRRLIGDVGNVDAVLDTLGMKHSTARGAGGARG